MKHERILKYERTSLKLDPLSKPIKLERSESLKKMVPEEGYRYIDLGMKSQVPSTLSKNGITFEMDGQMMLLKVEQMERVLSICEKIKTIGFFTHFYQAKLFFVWRKEIKIKRFNFVREVLKTKVAMLYPMELVHIKEHLFELEEKKVVKMLHLRAL